MECLCAAALASSSHLDSKPGCRGPGALNPGWRSLFHREVNANLRCWFGSSPSGVARAVMSPVAEPNDDLELASSGAGV